jgi:ribonuclease P protein component
MKTERPRPFERLTKRSDFLAAAKGRRFHTSRLTIQAFRRPLSEPDGVEGGSGGLACGPDPAPRFGLTVTRKTGNAVARNRIKRRLREALRRSAALVGMPGIDYVIVARREALDASFDRLVADLEEGLRRSSPKPARAPSSPLAEP